MVKGTERKGPFLEITRQVSGRIHSTQAAPTPQASRKAPPGAPASQGGPHCLPPPTTPGFLESDSWEAYLASVHPLGPRVLLRTTWVSMQPACQSPCCLSRAPVARLLHSSQTYIHLLLQGEHREPASPPAPHTPPPSLSMSAPSAFSSLMAPRPLLVSF